jgi:hypothetical protein
MRRIDCIGDAGGVSLRSLACSVEIGGQGGDRE